MPVARPPIDRPDRGGRGDPPGQGELDVGLHLHHPVVLVEQEPAQPVGAQLRGGGPFGHQLVQQPQSTSAHRSGGVRLVAQVPGPQRRPRVGHRGDQQRQQQQRVDDDDGGRHGEQPGQPGEQVHRRLHQPDRRLGAPGGALHVVGERVGVERLQPYRGGHLEQAPLHLAAHPRRQAVLRVPGGDAHPGAERDRRRQHGQRGQRRPHLVRGRSAGEQLHQHPLRGQQPEGRHHPRADRRPRPPRRYGAGRRAN